MHRVHFTVTLQNGSRYDANHIASTFTVDPASGQRIPTVAFITSGIQQVFPAAEVAGVEFQPPRSDEYTDYCSECDNPI